MNILGEAYVVIRSDGSQFASDIESGSAPAFSKLETDAEDSGALAGANLRGGVSKELGGMEKDAEAAGASAGGKLSSALNGAVGNLPGVEKISSILGEIPIPAAIGAAAIVAVGAAALDLGMKFDDTTAKIAATAGISQQAADAIGKAFLDTAGTTTFTGQEIASAYQSVAGQLGTLNGKALDAAQAMDVMRAAMDLAEATGTSLSSTTADISQVLQTFRLSVSDSATVSDQLFNVSRTTGQGVDSVTSSLTKLAAGLGANAPPLSTMSGLIEDLATHGESGRKAISALTVGLTALATPTSKVADAAKQMGITLQNSSGQFVGMGSVMDQLRAKMVGMNTTQQTLYLSQLLGAKGAAQWQSTIEAGSGALDLDTLAMSKHNSASDAAAKATDTFSGAFDKVKAAATDALTLLGTKMAPALTELGNEMSQVVAWITAHWPEISAVFGVVFKIVGDIIAEFASQVKLIMTILGNVIDFIKDIFTGKWGAAWDALKRIFSAFVDYVKGEITRFLSLFSAIQPALSNVWNTIASGISTAWNAIVGFFASIPTRIVNALGNLLALITGAFGDAASWVNTNVIEPVVGFFTALPGRILAALGAIVTTIWSGLVSAASWVNSNVIQPVLGFFTALPGQIVSALGAIVTTIWGGLVAAASWVNTNVIQPTIAFFTALPGEIVTTLGSITTTIWNGLTGAASWVNTNVIEPVVAFFTSLPSKIVSGLGDITHTIFANLTGAASWVLTNVITPVAQEFSKLPGQIASAISGAIGALGSIGTAIINAIIGAINDAINFYNDHRPSLFGVSLLPAIPDIPMLAAGGKLAAGQWAIVGEDGPELFQADAAGSIIPNTQLRSAGGVLSPPTAANHSASGSLGDNSVNFTLAAGAVVINVPSGAPNVVAATKQAVQQGMGELAVELRSGVSAIRKRSG